MRDTDFQKVSLIHLLKKIPFLIVVWGDRNTTSEAISKTVPVITCIVKCNGSQFDMIFMYDEVTTINL